MVQGLHLGIEQWLLVAIPTWVVLRSLILLIRKRQKNKTFFNREIATNIFALYIICLVGITLFPVSIYWVKQTYSIKPFLNYIPFFDISKSLQYGAPIKYVFLNLTGNLLLFTPMGFFLPILWNRKFSNIKIVLLFSFLISFAIELTQYLEGILLPSIIPRSSDINDIIINILGSFLGYFSYFLLLKNGFLKNYNNYKIRE